MKRFAPAFVVAAAMGVSACSSPGPAAPANQSVESAPAAAIETPSAETPPAETPSIEANATGTDSDATASTGAAAPAVFAQCRTCHTTASDGANGVGPNLWGVAGEPAAKKPGFAYSQALKDSGFVWDDATLDKWLAGPMKDLPGTKMAFVGLPDPAKRQEVIAYLKTLK